DPLLTVIRAALSRRYTQLYFPRSVSLGHIARQMLDVERDTGRIGPRPRVQSRQQTADQKIGDADVERSIRVRGIEIQLLRQTVLQLLQRGSNRLGEIQGAPGWPQPFGR